jgi:hypothetical protein
MGVVVGRYQPLADDGREPRHPTIPAFCSRFRRQRETAFRGFFFGLFSPYCLQKKAGDRSRQPPRMPACASLI